MRLIKNILIAIIVLFVLLIGVLLAVQNQQLVTIDLVFFQLSDVSLAFSLVLSFAVGAVLSLLLTGLGLAAMNLRLRRAKQKLKDNDRELDKLRTLKLNSDH